MHSVKLSDIRQNLKSKKNIVITNINKLYEQSIRVDNNKCDDKSHNNSIENIYKQFFTQPSDNLDTSNNLDTSDNLDTSNNVKQTNPTIYIKTEHNKTNSIDNIINILKIDNSHLTLDNYYIQGTSNNHSYFEALMLSIDDNYQKYKLLSTDASPICSQIMKIERDISSEALAFIKSNDIIKEYYSKNRIKLKEIPQKLFKNNNVDVDEDLKLFLADYYKVNIILINMTNKKYRVINDYNKTNNTIVFLEHKYKYEPILSVNKSMYNNLVQFIYDNIEQQKILLKSIGPISKYKLSDLQKIALELNISIDYLKNDKIKKKLKKDLYSEIVNNIKDI